MGGGIGGNIDAKSYITGCWWQVEVDEEQEEDKSKELEKREQAVKWCKGKTARSEQDRPKR